MFGISNREHVCLFTGLNTHWLSKAVSHFAELQIISVCMYKYIVRKY